MSNVNGETVHMDLRIIIFITDSLEFTTLHSYKIYSIHPVNRINTIVELQGIFQLKRLTLHYMNNDQRRTKQEKVETKIFSETPAMCGMSASKDLADAKSTKI